MSQLSINVFNDDGDLAVEIGSESDKTFHEAPIPLVGSSPRVHVSPREAAGLMLGSV